MGQLKFDLFLRKTDVLLTPNNHWFFIQCNFSKSIELLYVLRCHAILRYIYLYLQHSTVPKKAHEMNWTLKHYPKCRCNPQATINSNRWCRLTSIGGTYTNRLGCCKWKRWPKRLHMWRFKCRNRLGCCKWKWWPRGLHMWRCICRGRQALEWSVLGGLKQTKIISTVHFGRPMRKYKYQRLPDWLMTLPDNNNNFVELSWQLEKC